MAAPIYIPGLHTPVAGDGDDTVGLLYPATTLLNDILVAVIFIDAGASGAITSYNTTSFFPNLIVAGSIGSRRGIAAYWKTATGYEGGSGSTFAVTTDNGIGLVAGTVGLIRGGMATAGSLYSGGTSDSSPSGSTIAPTNVTTTGDEELLISAMVWEDAAATITAIDANGWIQGEAAAVTDGVYSFMWNYLAVPTATTISGGSAMLSASSLHRNGITFAVKPLYPEGTDQYGALGGLVTTS